MIELDTQKKYIMLRDQLIHISKVVEIDGLQGLSDANKHLEKVFCGLLNQMYPGANYVNLNTYEDKNYPGVDLAEHSLLSFFQITSTPSQYKVDHSYEVFLNNKQDDTPVYNLRFVILKLKARSSYVKQPPKYDANKISFNPKADYLDIGKLLSIISQSEESIVDGCVDYLAKVVRDNPIEAVDLDAEVLRAFFAALNDAASEDIDVEVPPSLDEIKIKEQRLGEFWGYVYECYKTLITPAQERKFKRTYNLLDEGARTTIERFLRYNSFSILQKHKEPEQAFSELKNLILQKISPFPISHSELEEYLCMEIVYCNVFPNPVKS